MGLLTPVKVIKRVRLEREAAEGASTELSAAEKAGVMAATVKGWISEFRQARPARYRVDKQRLGWAEAGVDGSRNRAVSRPGRREE